MIRAVISNVDTPIVIDSADISHSVGERSTATFTVNDPGGILEFKRGQPVLINEYETVAAPTGTSAFSFAPFSRAVFSGPPITEPSTRFFSGIIERSEKIVFPAKTYPAPFVSADAPFEASFSTVPFGSASFSGGFEVDTTLPTGETERIYAQHRIYCVDYHYSADKRLAAKSYEGETAGAIVTDLFNSYLEEEGLTLGTIEDGPVIEQAVFNYVKVSDCLDSLAERANFWWFVDEDKVLNFIQRGTLDAPWIATGSDMKADSIRLMSEAPKYRNRQVVKGSRDLTSEQEEIFVGDGVQTTFTVGFNISKVPTVEYSTDGGINWIGQTVGIKGLDSARDYYWSAGDPSVVRDNARAPLADGDLLRVTYQGEFDIIVFSEDTASIISNRNTEIVGTGVVEEVRTESVTQSSQATFQLAAQIIQRYGTIGRTLTFRTRRAGLHVGQQLLVNLEDYGLEEVFMLITDVQAGTESGLVMWYDVTCIEGPETKSWQNLFKAIADTGEEGVRLNVGEGTTLIIPYQFEKDWTEVETPNIFRELYTGPALTPSTTLYPAFDPDERVTILEWSDSTGPIGRKTVTQASGTDELLTITYMSPDDGEGKDITSFAWYGGVDATETLGTGVKVDEQTTSLNQGSAPWSKTSSESWQVEKTDRKW